MQARDVMVRGVISVGPDIPVQIAAIAMVRNCVSALPVINIYAKLVGIVSEGDLIRRVEIGTERRRSGGREKHSCQATPWRRSSSSRTPNGSAPAANDKPDWVESDRVL